MSKHALPVATVIAALLVVWYVAALLLNWTAAAASPALDETSGFLATVEAAYALKRPLLPAPHQILGELMHGVFGYSIVSPRSLLFHAGVTAEAALAGLAIALPLGLGLAIGIVSLKTLDRALMPWLIASQTIPVLAIAPMVVVVLGNIGLGGLLPKALIAGWLSFFPLTVGMVTGLRSPDAMQVDLLRTYAAPGWRVMTLLRFPASVRFLFTGLRVAVALALVGAIVAELPTGAQAGLGARLLAGSYYGQTIQLWAALFMASILALAAIGVVGLIERGVAAMRGGRL